MSKRKIKRIIIIIVVIAAFIMGIKLITNKGGEGKHRLEDLYKELSENQYLFEWQQNDKNKTIMAKKDNKTIIDNYSGKNHTTTIIKDNNTYFVLHDREEYYVYEQNNVEENILTDELAKITKQPFATGQEKVKGKKYSYEEYSGSTMFITSTTLDKNNEEIRTRFYFDKDDNLIYIQTLKGATQELLKVKLEKDVEDSMFDIPSNYAEN